MFLERPKQMIFFLMMQAIYPAAIETIAKQAI
jgi:hypothetical protein